MSRSTQPQRATAPATARNYHPLPVTIHRAEGAWVTDTDGRRYLDALAGYSALNFGHRHPALVAALEDQLGRVTLTSRAFDNDRLEEFSARLAALAGKDAVLTMNTGAEAVETAIKLARRWGHHVRGVPRDRARIIVMDGNFHGRTTTIVGFSSDPDARDGFGPFTPGFTSVPYGDADALEAALDDDTVAVLLEPVQGEAGVVLPPPGFLARVRELTSARGVLLVADEIQSGLGRTGTTFACDLDDVVPDVLVLGKALGGGLLPVSAVLADRAVMDVFTPGSHGSTFGGNPLACAVGVAVVDLLETGAYQQRSRELGQRLRQGLADLDPELVDQVRTCGLWAGVDLACGRSARAVCEALLERGVLAKDTHGSTLRLSPPLVVDDDEVDLLTGAVADAVAAVAGRAG